MATNIGLAYETSAGSTTVFKEVDKLLRKL
jgi:hypothetical protein